MAFHLEKRWKKLFSSALYRSKTLHSTRVKFSQMTAIDIEKFKQEVSKRSYFATISLHVMTLRGMGCAEEQPKGKNPEGLVQRFAM